MKLGIALGGGGAKGFAHIGILQVLQEHGIDFEVVTGTSIGALVGAVYVGGSLGELEQTAKDIRLTDIPLLLSPTWSLSGFFSAKTALDMLEELVPYTTIEELPKTFAAVSVDLLSERLIVHKTGNIAQAVRASSSIPALFTPIKEQSCVLVDGGLLEPVPVALCRELGATHVLAVDLFGNRQPAEETQLSEDKKLWPQNLSTAMNYLKSAAAKLKMPSLAYFEKSPGSKAQTSASVNFIEVIESTLAISQRQLTEARLAESPPDVCLRPAVCDVGLLDFHRAAPVIALGRRCAEAALPEIEKMLAAQ